MKVKNNTVRSEGCTRSQIRQAVTFLLESDLMKIGSQFNRVIRADPVEIMMHALEFSDLGVFTKTTLLQSLLRAIE